MYTLLIVDDEALIRKSIVKIIDWYSLGFSEIYEAEDGIEALEICRKYKINLVLTDIVMPFMDGMELAQKLSEEYPDIQVVILTGHEDFEYAKQSIDLGVTNYILKPVGAASLYTKMQEICHKLNMEANQKEFIMRMKNQAHRSRQILQEKFLYTLVCRGQVPSNLDERIESLELPLLANHYVVGVVAPYLEEVEQADVELFKFTVQNIAFNSVGKKHSVFDDYDNKVVVVFQTDTYEEWHILVYETLMVIKEAVASILKIPVACAMGKSVDSRSELSNSYRTACKALECRYSLGYNRVYDFRDLNYTQDDYIYPYAEIEKLIDGIQSGKEERIQSAIERIRMQFIEKKKISWVVMKTVMIEVITALFREISFQDEVSQKLWQEGMKLFQYVEKARDIEELIEPVEVFSMHVSSELYEKQNNRSQDIVKKVQKYVEDNFQKTEISLTTAAEFIAVSSGYLSSLFKKATGVNFVKYLTDVRMEQAKKLLKQTDMRTYEIAYETGFSDPHYFSISFKKYTGMSPSDYRSALEEDCL